MILLKSNPFKVIEIKKSTKAEMFRNVEVGDILGFEMSIKHSGRSSGGGVYASNVYITNITKNDYIHKTQSELTNILNRCFVLEEMAN